MKLLRDIWLIFQRQMTLVLRNPVWVIVGIIQPLYYLLLFAPLLKKALTQAGAHTDADVYRLFVPGILVMLAIFGTFFVGFALIAELRAGVIERSRVTPVSRLALLLGLIALMLSALSYGIALKLRSEDALAPLLNTVGQPILLLSGILLPLALAPGWLQGIARWNPFSWAVDAARALFDGHPGDASVWKALIILGVLTIASVTWTARSFARSIR